MHRVKILFNKKDNALIQMADPTQAQQGKVTFVGFFLVEIYKIKFITIIENRYLLSYYISVLIPNLNCTVFKCLLIST